MPTSTMLTVDAVAKRLLVHRNHVVSLIHSGELPASNVGGQGRNARYRISEADLERWIESRRVAA